MANIKPDSSSATNAKTNSLTIELISKASTLTFDYLNQGWKSLFTRGPDPKIKK